MMAKTTTRLLNLLLVFLPFFIFYPSLKYFFFQDDFLHLKTTIIGNFSDFLSFFKPPEEAIYYRPLSLQIYFFLTQLIFGLKPIFFRLIAFIFFLMNVFLVKKLITKLTKNIFIGFSVSFLYGISSCHFITLFWICEFSLILGMFFFLLSLLCYPRKLSWLFFSLGLLSHELIIILPVLLFFYWLIFKKDNIKNLTPFLIIGFLYLVFRFIIFPIPLKGTYSPVLNIKTLNIFLWYFLWSLNLPEELKYQAFSSILIRKEFILTFLNDCLIWGAFLLVIFIFSFILPFFNFEQNSGLQARSKKNFARKKYIMDIRVLRFIIKKPGVPKETKKILLFGLLWFLIAVFPLLLTPFHQYPMYLIFALPGLYLILISWVFLNLKKSLIALFLVSFFFVSFKTVRFTEKTHWVVREANQAERIINKGKTYPNDKKTVFFLNDDPELKAALNDQDALKVFFGENTQVFYGNKENLFNSQKATKGYKIIEIK